MSILKSSFSRLGVLVALAPSGFAAEYRLTQSEDCGPLTSQIVNESLVLRFDQLEADSNDQQFNEKNCEIHAEIKVPKGIKFRPTRAFADGEVFTSEQGSAEVRLTYSWMGMDESTDQYFGSGGSNGDIFSLTTAMRSDWMYSECQEEDQWVSMGGEFDLSAFQRPTDELTSNIALFNAEGSFESKWDWDFQACDNPWQGLTFRSRYTNPNGKWIRGTTAIDSQEGFYQTDSGSHGKFMEVKYLDF